MAVLAPVERYGPATLRVTFSVVRADGATLRTVEDENISGRMYKLHHTDTVSGVLQTLPVSFTSFMIRELWSVELCRT